MKMTIALGILTAVACAVVIYLFVFVIVQDGDNRKCIRGHIQPIVVGKVISAIYICDEYEISVS